MDGKTHDIGKWDLLIAHPPCTYGGQNSDVMKLLELYFTSGAYVSGDKEKRQ